MTEDRKRIPTPVIPGWIAAFEAADWQCERTVGSHRCEHRGKGPGAFKLFVLPFPGKAPGIVMCEPCAKAIAAKGRKTQRESAAKRAATYQTEGLF